MAAVPARAVPRWPGAIFTGRRLSCCARREFIMERRVKKPEPIPPKILEFAKAIRKEFGPGVRLYKGKAWPGGSR